MPLVRVRFKEFMPGTHNFLVGHNRYFCAIIADALSCDDPGARLSADEIEIYLDPADSGDHNTPDLSFDIEACFYPGRAVNHQERADEIRRRILSYFVAYVPSVGVWLKLVSATWSGED